MSEVPIKTVFKLRRGISSDWEKVNPILAQGEPGFELDTNKLKIGDGHSSWNDLSYLTGISANIQPDEKSIVLSGSTLSLLGFQEANTNYSIRKNNNGELEWFAPATKEEFNSLKEIVDNITTNNITGFSINGSPISPVKGTINLEIANDKQLGVVLSNNNANFCSVTDKGEIQINSVGVSKLQNEDGVSLVLSSGNASNKI